MNKKRILAIFMILILFIVGCNKNISQKDTTNEFNVQLSKKVATRYLECLKRNDIEGANSMSTSSLASQNKVKDLSDMPILSFLVGNLVETGGSAYIEYICARNSRNTLNASLDTVTLQVAKEDGEYKVSDVKSDNIKEVYVDKDNLRSVINGAGSDELIFRLNDLPTNTYTKDITPPIKKEKIPRDKFSSLGISYMGGKIGFATTDGKDSLIGIATVEQEKPSMASIGESIAQDAGTNSQGVDDKTLKEIFEKPTAQKIICYDILRDSKIEDIIFTEGDGDLLVQYTKKGQKGTGLKIYKNPDGRLLSIEFEKLFPMDKYSIIYEMATKTELIISVIPVGDKNNISQAILGKYSIDLVKEEMNKI